MKLRRQLKSDLNQMYGKKYSSLRKCADVLHSSVQSCFFHRFPYNFTFVWKLVEIVRKSTKILFHGIYGIPQKNVHTILWNSMEISWPDYLFIY